MKTFKVYKHPRKGYEAIKKGFCWPAFFFSWPWMLVTKLWLYSFIYLFIFIALKVCETALSHLPAPPVELDLALSAGYLLTALIPGYNGNKWREDKLKRIGYEMVLEWQADKAGHAISQVKETLGDNDLQSIMIETGLTRLMTCVIESDNEGCKRLIDSGVDINQQDSKGATALIHSVLHNNEQIVGLLLAKGADSNIPTNRGLKPLAIAKNNNLVPLIKLLMNHNVT